MNNPLVSVIIPTYNRSAYLCQTIDGILMQTYKNIEIVIIDDCSTDDTCKIIKEKYNIPQIKLIKNTVTLNAGLSRRTGYLNCSGEYIVFCDDDDFYIDENFFEDAMNKHINNPNLSFVAGQIDMFYQETGKIVPTRRFVGKVKNDIYINGLFKEYHKPHTTFTSIFNKKALICANFENMEMMNDVAIFLRAILYGDVEFIENIAGHYRVHGSSFSANSMVYEFIKENLDEKIWTFDRAKSLNIYLSREWFTFQSRITIDYYLSSKPPFKDKFKLAKWYLKSPALNKLKFIIKLILK